MARVLLQQCVLAMALVQTLWALAPVRCRTAQLRFSRRVSVVSAAPGERSPADLAYESEQLSLFNSALSQLTKREGTVSVPASPLISSGTAAWSPSVADVDNSVPKSTFTPPKPVGAHAGKIKLKDPPVFFFGDGVRHAALANKDTKTLKNLLGGKGAALADMGFMGLSVPPGFTITTETCAAYHSLGGTALPEGVWEEILLNVRSLEKSVNKRLGSTQSPLLVSVRSGAAISMPGMMDTVLNLGESLVECYRVAFSAANNPPPLPLPLPLPLPHRPERRVCGWPGPLLQRRALRLRLVSPPAANVWHRRARNAPPRV